MGKASVPPTSNTTIPQHTALKSSVVEHVESCPSNVVSIEDCKLRRCRDSVPWRLWVVALIQLCERAAFWGFTAPWQNYMENRPPHGALGLGQVKATRMYCAFYIFYYVTPLFVAPLADSWFGPHTALLIFSPLYCCGCAVLTISSLPANLANGWGLPGMICTMILIAIAGGGFKAIIAPFIADQYENTGPTIKTLKSGERVLTDYELTLQYIYSVFFWAGNFGSLSWFATVYLERNSGFAAAYGLTLGFMILALLILIIGRPWFVIIPHKENIVPQTTKIVICAVREGFSLKCTDPEYQFVHRHKTVSWKAALVGDLTQSLRACRVLLAFLICATPNDLLPAMNQVGCIVLGLLIQGVFFPFLHKRRIYISPVTRISIGFIFTSLAMLYAAFVQYAIYASKPGPENKPNVWIQAPLYFLIAIAEIFAYVSGLEYAYNHSPDEMKVFVQAISQVIAGAGSLIALAIAQAAHDPNLVYFYTALMSGMAVTTLLFWIIYQNHDKNNMDSRGNSEAL